jgi:hypothetical protein
MVALILEQDQHSRAVLGEMLGDLGFEDVFPATGFLEIEYLIRQNLGRIRLILSSTAILDGPDIPLTRLIIREPPLHLVPFILMMNGGLDVPLNRMAERLSRVDGSLRKPFGIQQLEQSISTAHRRRSSLRSSLLVLGPSLAPQFAESFYACRNLVHWQEVVPLHSAAELGEKIDRLGFRVGGILLDPGLCDAAVITRISKYRKTHEGSTIPIAALGRDAERIAAMRPFFDQFFDLPDPTEPVEWEEIVLRMSHRTLLAWDSREIIGKCRKALGAGKLPLAQGLAKRGLGLDGERWEFRELAGTVALRQGNRELATRHFRAAQQANPCSPFAYINLIELLQGAELESILTLALAYCPRHPQVLAAVSRRRGLGADA